MLLFNPGRKNCAKDVKNNSSTPGSFKSSVTDTRRPYGSGDAPLPPRADLVTPSGTFTQIPFPPALQSSNSSETSIRIGESQTLPITRDKEDKRMRQLRRWVDTAVPEMVQPFLDMVEQSGNLRNIDRDGRRCSCAPTVHAIQVLCVHLDKLEYRCVCSCSPAANLVAIGYFPSSPSRPSLAVDIKMLEFMSELFVRSPPNITAWSAALEVSLESLGYKLASSDTLRRKMGACVRWYRFLVATKDVVVDNLMDMVGEPSATKLPNDEGREWVDNKNTSDGKTPSPYLQDRCPLCFGGKQAHDPSMLVDVVVCIDANFQQKRRKTSRGTAREPPFVHPRTVFLSDADINIAKDLYTSKHGKQPQEVSADLHSGPADSGEDAKEPGMKVPKSALDGCRDSFLAADERRTKASTRVFADTGVMGLL
ncbi:hypothetical protein BKA70DRAFT_1132993 [Coprinopsis sp. MPI-PUGE-AT-0042]|nr:hypothetical protein BKA70DRAFT_1132993 [Coprinopsis sp. MPI-PUGE-AT-0042]